MKLSPHFDLWEFASRNEPGGPLIYPEGQILENVQHLANQLEALRAVVGRPIRVISGYRTPEHNARVGGAPKSQHLLGKAADIKIGDMTPSQVAELIEDLIRQGKMVQGGLGIYPTFVHYDTRGIAARWNG